MAKSACEKVKLSCHDQVSNLLTHSLLCQLCRLGAFATVTRHTRHSAAMSDLRAPGLILAYWVRLLLTVEYTNSPTDTAALVKLDARYTLDCRYVF